MRAIRAAAFAILLLLAATGPAPAQGEAYGEQLTIYLVTMGTGDAVWEKYGHNALWVRDPIAGTDLIYNYGVFDFNAPGYWGRFVRGDWLYQLAVWPAREALLMYERDNRTIVLQELDLTGDQKAEMNAFLEWNAQPENRDYLYDYFRDNCSTRIRDVLDAVLGGTLRAATDSVPTATTFRWHSRRLMAGMPVVYTALNAGLGPESDQPISAWEEMFLPEKLMEWVREVQVTGEDGGSRPLVRSEEVMYEAQGRSPDREAPPSWIPVYLAIGTLLAGVMVLLARGAHTSSAARAGFAITASIWSLLVGFGGLLLLGLWLLTNHTAAHRNENLLQFDPLALPLVVLVPALVFGARRARGPARTLALAVAAFSVVGLLMQVVPGLDQVNGEIIALMLPPNLALAWGVMRLAEDPAATRSGDKTVQTIDLDGG